MPNPRNNPADSFDRSARAYDELVARNREGCRRLINSLPEREFPRLVDVGCGTGFATLDAIDRRGAREVICVDPSTGMLDVLGERLAAIPGITADLRPCEVMDMGVDPGWADLVLSTMALHWFTDRPGALREMANALAPGGVLGILCPGEGHDRPTVDMFEATGDPLLARLAASIVNNQVPVPDLTQWITDAGLTPLDVWSETRYRVVPPQAIADRIEAVATHLWSDLPEGEQAEVLERVRATFADAADADGMYRYRFVKTFAVAERTKG